METDKMGFGDFERLVYITEHLGFIDYSRALWNQLIPRFEEQFENLMKLIEESDIDAGTDEMDFE